MNSLLAQLAFDNPTLMMSVLVFAAAASLAFGVMATVRVRADVKRRAAGLAVDTGRSSEVGSRSRIRRSSMRAAVPCSTRRAGTSWTRR